MELKLAWISKGGKCTQNKYEALENEQEYLIQKVKKLLLDMQRAENDNKLREKYHEIKEEAGNLLLIGIQMLEEKKNS